MTYVTRVIVAALTLVLLGALPADAARSPYGHTGAADRKLRDGCHSYRYRYVVKTPTNEWTLETFLVDPTGDTLASNTFISDGDPRRGHGRFRFCDYSTRPGVFKIRAKVHWYDDSEHKRWFKPSKFRIKRR